MYNGLFSFALYSEKRKQRRKKWLEHCSSEDKISKLFENNTENERRWETLPNEQRKKNHNAQQMTTIRKRLVCQSSISTRTKWRHKKQQQLQTHSNKRNEKAKEMNMLKANNSERWKVMIFLIFVFACFPNKYHFWMFHCLNSNLFSSLLLLFFLARSSVCFFVIFSLLFRSFFFSFFCWVSRQVGRYLHRNAHFVQLICIYACVRLFRWTINRRWP